MLRKNDLTLLIRQNNTSKSLEIIDASPHLLEVTGYGKADIAKASFAKILSPETASCLEYIEYSAHGKDVADVLQKNRSFSILSKNGVALPFHLRIRRSVSTLEAPVFLLIFYSIIDEPNETLSAIAHLRQKEMAENAEDLPKKQPFIREAEFVQFCVDKKKITASFALVRIDGLSKDEKLAEHLKILAQQCRIDFREEDIIGLLEDDQVAIILLQAGVNEAPIPLNRLRANIASRLNGIFTISCAYAQMKPGSKIRGLVKACKKALDAEAESNRLIQV